MSETTTGAPVGWDEWLAFLRGPEYRRDVAALIDAIRAGRTLDIGLSIECLASCAFAAGLDAGASPLPGFGDPAPSTGGAS